MPTSRARREAQKEERHDVIMAAAGRLLDTRPYASITMAHVAESAGLAKGTLYLYVRTKEALFLGLLQEALAMWLISLELDWPKAGSLDAAALAERLATSLSGRPALETLLALQHGVLEPNVGATELAEFRRAVRYRMSTAGERIERSHPAFAPGDGATLLLRAIALMTGLAPWVKPSTDRPASLAEWVPTDATVALTEALTALVRGMAHPQAAAPASAERRDRPRAGRTERPWG